MNNSFGLKSLVEDANIIIKRVEDQLGYLQKAQVGNFELPLAYCVWSAHVACPYCEQDFTIWDVTVDTEHWTETDEFKCPKCGADLTYPGCNKIVDAQGVTIFDPVRVSIMHGRRRYERSPNPNDLDRIAQASRVSIAHWYPDYPVEDGLKLSEPKNAHGLTRMSQFYTRR
ncbi:MAG: hypothetical protein JXA42_13150, partial [Anaerolineales bacterium]|nr:hypothetical protein [Anaerolineales bacterium]